MVFSLPGVRGGGDVGGGGDSWDRGEGDGDWAEASDKQMDRVKRLVANKQGNEIKDSEMADVEEDLELYDKKTGKKLTFEFPDASSAAASRGKGRGKGSCNGRAGARKSEKTEGGEKEKGKHLEVEATAKLPEMGNENTSDVVGEETIYEVTCKELKGEFHHDKFVSGGKGRCILHQDNWMTPNEFEKAAGSRAKKYKASLYVNGKPIVKLIDPHGTRQNVGRKSEKAEVRGEEEKGKHLEVEATATNNGMEIYDEPRGEMEKNAPEKDIYDDKPKGEREKNSQENGEPRGEKLKNTKLKDRTDNEQKGEKEKNPQLDDSYEPEEDEEDLFDDNFEDMEVVHEYPVKKGGPPHQPKCQYELIRDQIIADREALMRAVLADIQKTSREIVEDNEKCKKRKATDAGKANKEKKKKVEKVVDIEGARRSGRERKPVNYCALDDDDDPEWEPEGRKKKVERKRKRRDNSNDQIKDRKPLPPGWNPKWNHIHNPFEKKNRKNGGESSSSQDKNDGKDANSAETGRRSMRERKYVNYNFDDGPRADEFVFCERCGEDKYHGCELHPLIFDYVAHFDVGPSKVGKNAGRGVFNNDIRGDIPEGVMFGPYDGIFYTPKEYKLLKKTRGESGYAWELRDPDKIKVIGYVDPGTNPDPLNQWMSIVNCASKTRHQNLMPGQFIGGIYYRSMEIIHFGEELLVYYGNDYARDIKIKVEERDLYELYEDWEEEGVSCPHCGRGFVKQEFLQKHIDMVDSSRGGCKVLRREKNRAEVLAGLRPYVCEECGVGFKTEQNLNGHKATHRDAKPFICPECGKAYKSSSALDQHVKAEHEGRTYDCPDCERPFKQKSEMMKHWKNVCNREDQEFKCAQCGRKFNQNSSLNRHIKAVHNRELPHKCEACGKRFPRNGNLQRHILGVHEKARPHVCEDCGATYQDAVKLDHHRIKKHTLQWYWNCDICDDEGFLLPRDLKKHMLRHHPVEYKEQVEREKPAVCPKCQKRFPSEDQVDIHLKKMHN